MLNKIIENLLKTISDNVYEDEAPDDAKEPYIVFNIKRITTVGIMDQYNLEINVWDTHKTYARANDLLSKVDQAINFYVYTDSNMFVEIYKGPQEKIVDSDKHVKRIREQCELRFIERS